MTNAEARERAVAMLGEAGIVLTPHERETIEVADFGLGQLDEIGLQIVVYVNTDRVCAKELVIFPHQRCTEHGHPPLTASPARRRRSASAAVPCTCTSMGQATSCWGRASNTAIRHAPRAARPLPGSLRASRRQGDARSLGLVPDQTERPAASSA